MLINITMILILFYSFTNIVNQPEVEGYTSRDYASTRIVDRATIIPPTSSTRTEVFQIVQNLTKSIQKKTIIIPLTIFTKVVEEIVTAYSQTFKHNNYVYGMHRLKLAADFILLCFSFDLIIA